MMNLRAGTKAELPDQANPWVILDIGFSKNPTCGLVLGSTDPRCVNFGEACKSTAEWINKQKSSVNLMIEAPLSMAFDRDGNPGPRTVEKFENKTRPWYCGPGATVLIAALTLVVHLRDRCPDASIKLFEGFVSFKPTAAKSDHIWDARQLREALISGPSETVEFWGEEDLQAQETTLTSIFMPCGFDPGIPAIVRITGRSP